MRVVTGVRALGVGHFTQQLLKHSIHMSGDTQYLSPKGSVVALYSVNLVKLELHVPDTQTQEDPLGSELWLLQEKSV